MSCERPGKEELTPEREREQIRKLDAILSDEEGRKRLTARLEYCMRMRQRVNITQVIGAVANALSKGNVSRLRTVMETAAERSGVIVEDEDA